MMALNQHLGELNVQLVNEREKYNQLHVDYTKANANLEQVRGERDRLREECDTLRSETSDQ